MYPPIYISTYNIYHFGLNREVSVFYGTELDYITININYKIKLET